MTPLVRRLLAGIDHPSLRVAASVLLAALASGASVALMGVSAWLLSRAAELPPVMYLTAAAVGVRFFGISRGVFRYLERLVGHDLGLRLQSALRLETYATLARTTLLGRRRGDLLTRVVADVDAILDLVVRVAIPFASGGVVVLGTSLMLGVFSPASAAVLLASALLAGAVAPWLAARLSLRADADALPARGELANLVHEIARTAPDLVAYGADATHLARLEVADAHGFGVQHRLDPGQGHGGPRPGLGGLGEVGQHLVEGERRQAEHGEEGAVEASVEDGLPADDQRSEHGGASRDHLQRGGQRAGPGGPLLGAAEPGVGDLAAGALADAPGVTLRDVAIGWPGGETLHEGLDLQLVPGDRVAVVGPSGSGKTTLAATVLGLIPPHAGTVSTRGRVGYLAQDAHVFSTNVTENVRIGRRDATGEQVADALARVRLDVEGARLVGEQGAALSGGEARRLALARLAVGEYQVLVLDEPSEHLDPGTATALLDDIFAAAGDAPLLIVTHDPAVIARCDRRLVLSTVPTRRARP